MPAAICPERALLVLRLLLELGAEQIAQGAEALAGWRRLALVGLVLGAVRCAIGGHPREAVAALLVQVDDLRPERGARRRGLLVVRAARRAQLGVGHQTLAVRPGDEHPVSLDAIHLRVHYVADPRPAA